MDQDKYCAADEDAKKEMLVKVTPTATRHLFLIRHGQYHLDSEQKNLTPLGRNASASNSSSNSLIQDASKQRYLASA